MRHRFNDFDLGYKSSFILAPSYSIPSQFFSLFRLQTIVRIYQDNEKHPFALNVLYEMTCITVFFKKFKNDRKSSVHEMDFDSRREYYKTNTKKFCLEKNNRTGRQEKQCWHNRSNTSFPLHQGSPGSLFPLNTLSLGNRTWTTWSQ